MVETFVIGDDADVRQAAEEHQRSELKFFFLWRRRKCRPIRTRRAALKTHAHVLISSPNKAGTIERIGTGSIEVIARSQMRFDRRQQLSVVSARQGENGGSNYRCVIL